MSSKPIKLFFLETLILTMFVSACGKSPFSKSQLDEAWQTNQGPEDFSSSYETQLSELPLVGKAASLPWLSNYWPEARGATAYRWNKANPESGFSYDLLTKSQVKSLSQHELAQLSPMEKFDIYRGRFDYPEISKMREYSSPFVQPWLGLCDGVAIAASHTKEPRPVTLRSRDNIAVPFGSSDVKALLAYYHSRVAFPQVETIGRYCASAASFDDSFACKDVNPGVFHIVVSNELGLKNRHFIADMTWNQTKWNHIIFEYTSKINQQRKPSHAASPQAVKEFHVVTSVAYANTVKDSFEPIPLSAGTSWYRYEYWLELDSADKIVGGTWITVDHPDVLWRSQLKPYTGEFAAIGDIYRASIGEM